MFRFMLYLLIMTGIAGCAPVHYTWQHPDDPGVEQLTREFQGCQTIVNDEMTYSYPGYGHRHHIYRYRSWPYYARDPYWHRYDYWPYGYGWYEDPFAWQDYRDDLFRVCMRAKGWRQVPVEEK
ncbi:MAG: hypothetical protein GWN87_29745 [Desulfuromonadales bacterium]|nr:hypothetical protein [Desulfuromonadales bacterium]